MSGSVWECLGVSGSVWDRSLLHPYIILDVYRLDLNMIVIFTSFVGKYLD